MIQHSPRPRSNPFGECTFDVDHLSACDAFIIIIITHCLFTINLIKYTFCLPTEVKQTAEQLFSADPTPTSGVQRNNP